MNLRYKFFFWLLRRHPNLYLKLKGLEHLALSHDDVFLALHTMLLRQQRGSQSLAERYNLYRLATATNTLRGAMAEAGVYRGGSARILCEVKGDSRLYLFDTFEGMPQVNARTDGNFLSGDFSDTSLKDVSEFLNSFANVRLYPGVFPLSVSGKEPEQENYKFVHLDLDLYGSTLKSLDFFYPKMVRGGIILAHDYSNVTVPGVRKAFDEFFQSKPEVVLPIWETQCAVIKL